MASQGNPSRILFHVDHQVGEAFSWLSIGLAILTALFQGLVTALALMTEASSHWTFRLRLALVEHWWWTFVSLLLLLSLHMQALAFASGNGGDAISVLALSSATFLAMVQYTAPAWQGRHFVRTRWLAWTGQSRTAIKRDKVKFCGNAEQWRKLVDSNKQTMARLQPTPSDYYGWRLWPVGGITFDPADVLHLLNHDCAAVLDVENGEQPVGVYANADPTIQQASLIWGPEQGFRIRISRAVSSMPLGLLTSYPTTTDGYDGKGLTKAMGILGRNKGLQPGRLVFNSNRDLSSFMENASTWTPRPTKVLRSFYHKTMDGQYHGLGPAYVDAAVELALLMADMPHWAIDKWLLANLEHQSLEINHFLADQALAAATPEERRNALAAHYESSYVSMIISLNAMDMRIKHHHRRRRRRRRHENNAVQLGRPDLLCTALLLRARNQNMSAWWDRPDVRQRRALELARLPRELEWRYPMAKLLGLDAWPDDFDQGLLVWTTDEESKP